MWLIIGYIRDRRLGAVSSPLGRPPRDREMVSCRACVRAEPMPGGNASQISSRPFPFSLCARWPSLFPEWVPVSSSESQWVQVGPSKSKWVQMNPSKSKWVQVKPSKYKWAEWVQVSPTYGTCFLTLSRTCEILSNMIQSYCRWAIHKCASVMKCTKNTNNQNIINNT